MRHCSTHIPLSGRSAWPAAAAILVLAVFAIPAVAGASTVCVVPDNGSGTASLPPVGCGYESLTPMQISDGLPPGEPVLADALLSSFFDITYLTGGTLGGEIQQFHGQLALDMTGTGSLAGFQRMAFFDVFCEMDSAPRAPGTPVQSFGHELVSIQGQLPPGDPDFDLLRISGGSGFGMPSPGHTTLTVAPGNTWAVDSFFDITYRIDFVGHPGGPFGGMSGSTTGTIRMQCGTETPVAAPSGTWGSVKALYE